ncbi:hypothetical protein C8R43DRAFT_1127493 [Mycena crocata]|nr:hypothetical protein C8R43DRAFT_1127493 [Mycena crocata]
MPELPQELIDAIIDEVPASSLRACSLTATAFVASSQRRIFQWASLSTIRSYERTEAILATSPHLGKYVRFLAIGITKIPSNYAPLQAILPALTEIERVSIVGDTRAQNGNKIGDNPCLMDLLSLPSLRGFALHQLLDVPSAIILRALGSFEEVLLSHLSIAADEAPDSEELPPPGDLWHLSLLADAYEATIPFALCPKNQAFFDQLARLSLPFSRIPEDLLPNFFQLLTSCSRTLEHLDIELEAPFTDPLPALPALWFLELWIDIDTVHSPGALASILSYTYASMPNLEVLTLSISDRPAGRHRHHWNLLLPDDPQPWTDVDSLLLDMRALCEVYVELRYFHSEPARYAGFVPYIKAKLPRAKEEGLLGFAYRPSVIMTHPMDRFAD